MNHTCRLHNTASEKSSIHQATGLINRARVTSNRGEESGPKHLVGRVISRTEGELTFQHNQRSEEYYLRSASKKATKLKATQLN